MIIYVFSLLILALYVSAGQVGTQNVTVRQVYTFPNNTFIEDIVVRSNGNLIISSESVPTLFSINASVSAPTAQGLYTFPNATGLSGLTEISPDIFALVTGIWDEAITRATSLAIWTIDFNSATPVVQHITDIVNSTIFNGIATVPGSENLILAADSAIGAVWRVNISSGEYGIVFQDNLFLPTGPNNGTDLGINGIRTRGSYLYFTSSAQGVFGRVSINDVGEKVGPAEVLANITTPLVVDAFALGTECDTWIATHPSDVVELKSDGSWIDFTNVTFLLNPTSAQFGRGSDKERRTLYVTNGGEFAGDDLINEGVVAIDTTHL